jgi:hypothetical protein
VTTLILTKATAEWRAAANAEKAASEAMKAAAATQPKGEGLIPITGADIAALVHAIDDSDGAKKLFCRDGYAKATAVSVTPAPQAAFAPPPAAPAAESAAPAVAAASPAVPLPRAAPAAPPAEPAQAPVHVPLPRSRPHQ